MDCSHQGADLFPLFEQVDVPGISVWSVNLAFGDGGNRTAEIFCKEKIVVEEDQVGFNIEEAKRDGSVANRFKLERQVF
jgi:hypothetical protein